MVFKAVFSEFVTGRPLNVTGADFGPDGALYFVTGGRRTKSGLYRVRYTRDPSSLPNNQLLSQGEIKEAESSRELRIELEKYHSEQSIEQIRHLCTCTVNKQSNYSDTFINECDAIFEAF